MIKWKKLAIGIFSVASTLAYSQQTVTLKQAIEFALQNKADALKARLDITNADAKIRFVLVFNILHFLLIVIIL